MTGGGPPWISSWSTREASDGGGTGTLPGWVFSGRGPGVSREPAPPLPVKTSPSRLVSGLDGRQAAAQSLHPTDPMSLLRGPGAPIRRRGAHPVLSADPQFVARPARWFSWDFEIRGVDPDPTHLDLSVFRERARFDLGGRPYTVGRDSLRGPWILRDPDDEPVATGRKTSLFRRGFTVEAGGARYDFRPWRALSRRFGLYLSTREVGWVGPARMFRRILVGQVPERFSPPERVFMIFLVVMTWRRDARAASG